MAAWLSLGGEIRLLQSGKGDFQKKGIITFV
jgi:hypothetical protein